MHVCRYKHWPQDSYNHKDNLKKNVCLLDSKHISQSLPLGWFPILLYVIISNLIFKKYVLEKKIYHVQNLTNEKLHPANLCELNLSCKYPCFLEFIKGSVIYCLLKKSTKSDEIWKILHKNFWRSLSYEIQIIYAIETQSYINIKYLLHT